MMTPNNKLNIILIGKDIETCILFKNAFSKLQRPCKVDHYYSINRALADTVSNNVSKPNMIFMDTNDSRDTSAEEVSQIRESKQFRDCSLVIYDSQSHLHDTNAIFAQGADAFINHPYHFPRISKVLGNIVNSNWNFDRYNAERVTYFL